MRPEVEISRRRLVWPNGAIAQIFSSEDPESLRGPQFHLAWCDELAKWKHADETFDMLQFALRLGDAPRQVVTTTPRPVPLLKRLMADEATRLTKMATAANAAHLAPGFLDALAARYGGTRLGRQELDGELIEDRPDALWKRARLDEIVVKLAEPLRRIVVAVDPPAGGVSACCGIVVAGLKENGQAVVLADCSVEGAGPAGWARAVVSAYGASRPTGWWPRSTRAATWCAPCWKASRRGCRDDGAGDTRQVPARRTGGGLVRAGAGSACGAVCRAGGPDV